MARKSLEIIRIVHEFALYIEIIGDVCNLVGAYLLARDLIKAEQELENDLQTTAEAFPEFDPPFPHKRMSDYIRSELLRKKVRDARIGFRWLICGFLLLLIGKILKA